MSDRFEEEQLSSASKPSTNDRKLNRGLPTPRAAAVIVFASLVAIGITSYLVWVALSSSKVAGCGGGQIFDCNDVVNSRWSRWLGIPVSILALGTYFCLLGGVIAGSVSKMSEKTRRIAWGMVVVLGMSAGIAAVWFIFLQFIVIRHLCTYCLAAHCCGLVIAVTLLLNRPLGGQAMKYLSMVSVAGIAVLISGQIMFKPVTYKIIEFETPVQQQDPGSPEVFEFAPPVFEFSPPPAAPAVGSDSGTSGNSNATHLPFAGTAGVSAVVNSLLYVQPVRIAGALSLLQGSAVQAPSAVPSGTQTQQEPNATPAQAAPGQTTDSAENAQPQNAQPQNAQPQNAQPQNAQPQSATGNLAAGEPALQPVPRRLVPISGGTIQLDVAQWPTYGNRNAKYIIVELFDYTCDHCRRTHTAIAGAKQILGDDLAVISLPVPMNTNCNNAITTTGPRMVEACDISRLAIAVWRVNPEKFAEFHHFLMTTPNVVTFAEARQQAAQLVDAQKLDAEMASPVPAQYIAQHVEIYRRVGAGSVPKLMFPATTVEGEFSSAQGLVDLIRQQIR